MSVLTVMAPLETISCSDMNAAIASSSTTSAEDEIGAASPAKDSASLKADSLDRAEKRKERDLKKAEKAAKRQKIEQTQKRSANFMSNFVQAKQASSPSKPEHVDSVKLSDYQRTFPPCTYKNMAPINRFVGKTGQSYDVFACAQTSDGQGIYAPVSVRDTMRLITEAGVLGDDRLEENGRRGFANLSNRKLVPMKLLHFESDRRPAWYGTWTRSSTLVGPRRPFGQDPVAIDYSYDSDAEWEDFDPNEGDDVQEIDNDEEDRCSRSDSDSELDDWLVDDLEDDEEEEGAEGSKSIDGVVLDAVNSPTTAMTSKGKSNGETERKKKRKVKLIGRRFESKLVKFETGPHWDQQLGITTYDGFRPYKMEMLNDAYIGLDPFAFESAVVDVKSVAEETTASADLSNGGIRKSDVIKQTAAQKGVKKASKKAAQSAEGLLRKQPLSRPVKLKDKLAAKGLLEQAITLLTQMNGPASTNTDPNESSAYAKSVNDDNDLREGALESIRQGYKLLFGSSNNISS